MDNNFEERILEMKQEMLLEQPTCKKGGCGEAEFTRGLCKRHYDDFLSVYRQIEEHSFEEKCSVKHCRDKEVYADGMCRMHYRKSQMKKYGTIFGDKPSHLCIAEGCGRPMQSNFLCQFHGRRMKRLGILHPAERKGDHDRCNVVGCRTAAHKSGFCKEHFNRYSNLKRKKKVSDKVDFMLYLKEEQEGVKH